MPPRYSSPALALDGSTGFVGCANVAPLQTLTAYTLEAWVSVTTLGGLQAIVSKGDLQTLAEFELFLSNGQPAAYYPGAPYVIMAASPITVNDWHHLAVTYDGTTLTLYVDGVNAAQQAFSGTALTSSSPALVGAVMSGGAPSQFFGGQIGSVMVWSEVRTPDQILEDSVQVSSIAATAEPNLELHLDFTMLPAVDRSGNDSTIVLNGGAAYAVATAGLLLDGSTAYANGGTNAALDFSGNAPYTVEGWFYLGTAAGTAVLASKGQTGAAQYALSYQNGMQIVAARNSDGGQIGSGPIPPNAWYHIAMAYDGGATNSLALYVNGNVQNVAFFPSAVASAASSPLTIGADGVSSFLAGVVQDVRVWNVALSQAQINQWMYNQPVDTPGLVASYDFSVNPPVDTTALNSIVLAGSAVAGYQPTAMPATSPAAIIGLPLPVNAVYLNAQDVTPNPPPDALEVAEQPKPLSDHHRKLAWNDFVARRAELGAAEPSGADRERFHGAWERARTMVRENPALLDVFTREERDGAVRLIYHGVHGDVVAWEGPADAISDCTLWWVQFVFALTVGFLQALGLAPSVGNIMNRVYNMVSSNAAVVAAMNTVVGQTITASSAITIVGVIYQQGLLWPIIKLVLTSAGWWTLAWLLKKIIAIVTGLEAAELLANFVVWAAQLTILSLKYTTACPTTRPAAAA